MIPGGEFHYRVLKSGEPVFEASAGPARQPGKRKRFVFFGDCAKGTITQRAVAYQTSLAHPDFLFAAGDIVYSNGRISEYRDKFFPVYSAAGAPLLRFVPPRRVITIRR